jgi:hypothetical protein
MNRSGMKKDPMQQVQRGSLGRKERSIRSQVIEVDEPEQANSQESMAALA